MWTLISEARQATSLQERFRLLHEITAYVMQVGPKGGRFYFTPKGKKVYRVLGGKTGNSRKLRQLTGEAYDAAWKSIVSPGPPIVYPDGESVGAALKMLFGNKAPDPKMIGDMFSDQGIEARPRRIHVTDRGTVAVSYGLHEENGTNIGDMDREFKLTPDGESEVYHDFLVLKEQWQGGGRGAVMLGKAMKAYKQMGVKKITVFAALDAGPYAWARFGFEANAPGLRIRKERFNRFLTDQVGLSPEDAEKVTSKIKDMHELSGIKIRIKGKDGKPETLSAGKDFLLHGSSEGTSEGWHGELDLDNPKAMSRWNRQVSKGRKQRKAAKQAGRQTHPLSPDEVAAFQAKIKAKTDKYKASYSARSAQARSTGTSAMELARRLEGYELETSPLTI